MIEQTPALLLAVPLFAALAVLLAGYWQPRLCLPIVLASLAATAFTATAALARVLRDGPFSYFLGSWTHPRGIGIEFQVDHLSGLVLPLIATVALLTAIHSHRRVQIECPDKAPLYYALYLLLVAGLLGMTVTADAFNLYVLLEVTSLTSYALVAMGPSKRAALAAFHYVILGTLGASFYLLGVGYLYIKTGTLNMAEIHRLIVEGTGMGGTTVQVAFILIMIGVWIKMALFPLSGWLPNAYTYAPSTTSCLIAPLMTKVAVYIMIRMMVTVFGPFYVFRSLPWSEMVVWAAVVAIAAGSWLALSQTQFKKMLCYLVIAEVGYMVGGAWLANRTGMVGAILHILSDALMTLCLFLTASILRHRDLLSDRARWTGLFHRMPLTMGAFVVAAFSMIGIPPTGGFFSKYYLLQGGLQAGHYAYVAALLLSSLVNAILFFRVIESAYFPNLAAAAHGREAGAPDGHAHSHPLAPKFDEAPASLLAPLLAAAAGVILVGLYNRDLTQIIQSFVPNF